MTLRVEAKNYSPLRLDVGLHDKFAYLDHTAESICSFLNRSVASLQEPCFGGIDVLSQGALVTVSFELRSSAQKRVLTCTKVELGAHFLTPSFVQSVHPEFECAVKNWLQKTLKAARQEGRLRTKEYDAKLLSQTSSIHQTREKQLLARGCEDDVPSHVSPCRDLE